MSVRTITKLEKLSSFEDRGQTDRSTALPCLYSWYMTLTFNPWRAMVMTHTRKLSSTKIIRFRR